ncbi:hypothetical protein B5807_12100 [Epicoccum nigrum]|uniref:RelA/SpoT domain-containing protein n=1 Tax=Epicoccum nigrum TaxID=105696 RepID=A0A1Y2LJC0_EPING|nr:hypothetical protein B5807_12100 [Epicoccum nigrum]
MLCNDADPRTSANGTDGVYDDVNNFPPPRALARTSTYIEATVPSAIDEFMTTAYSTEHYKALAEKAQKLLDATLKGARDSDMVEVQFKITYRAKTLKSLREKLEVRDRKRKYSNVGAILKDIKDLAGVRVVLYTPNKSQRLRVKQAIKQIWGEDIEEVVHGDPIRSRKSGMSPFEDERDSDNEEGDDDGASTGSDEDGYVTKNLGYQADHYRALMFEGQGDESYTWKPLDRVEVQVVSALGHVWAEAGHDVMYKTYAYGNPTKLERRILDALSGLITSGDLLLEEFRESVTKRTYTRWKHSDELAMWLRETDVMKQKEMVGNKPVKRNGKTARISLEKHFAGTGTDILYRFLTKIDHNYPIAVRDVLKSLGFPRDPAAGLNQEREKFGPGFNVPHGLLAPVCVISRLMPQTALELKQHDVVEKCSIMMDAFILLQTFCGTADAAKDYLLREIKPDLNDEEEESINFVLHDPTRIDCWKKVKDHSEEHITRELQASWDWFQKQIKERKLCGFFFRLAYMGVPAEEMGFSERLAKLNIKSLSRANTFEEEEIEQE